MKKFYSILVMLSLLICLGLPQNSKAVVGLLGGGPGMAMTGLMMTLGGGMVAGRHGPHPGSFFLVAMGLIYLDEDSGTISLEKINKESQEKLGLDESDVKIFNGEVEELNVVANDISAGIESEEDAKKRWLEVRDEFSPETFEVLEKVLNQDK